MLEFADAQMKLASPSSGMLTGVIHEATAFLATAGRMSNRILGELSAACLSFQFSW